VFAGLNVDAGIEPGGFAGELQFLRKAGGAGSCGEGDLGLLFRGGQSVFTNQLSVQGSGATESSEQQSSTAGKFFAVVGDAKTKGWRSMLRHYQGK